MSKKLKTSFIGKLPIGDIELDCAVLNDGTRVLTATSVFKAFGKSRKGQNRRLIIEGTKIPPFIASGNLKPYINDEVLDEIKLIHYFDGPTKKAGYKATILPILAGIYLHARRDKVLTNAQLKQATYAEIITTALAKVGIDALVDEATGYQYYRDKDALRILVKQYVAEEMQKWIKTFPDVFFTELDKLYDNEKTTSKKRPKYYGHFINRYIYKPLENGYVKEELDKKNIRVDGSRKAQFHRWLTNEGKSMLVLQIGKVVGLMEICKSIDKFRAASKKQKAISICPYLFDDMNDVLED